MSLNDKYHRMGKENIIFTLKMGKLCLWEIIWFVQGHKASEQRK